MNDRTPPPFVIGVLSDTHGRVPVPALAALAGVDHIIHAGDVVGSDVISTLENIAPVTAVRGNMDRNGPERRLPETQYVTLAGVGIYVLHDVLQLDLEPGAAGVEMVVHGHTHRARIEWIRETLYLNPGSAGQPRAGRPASIARVRIVSRGLEPEIVRLEDM